MSVGRGSCECEHVVMSLGCYVVMLMCCYVVVLLCCCVVVLLCCSVVVQNIDIRVKHKRKRRQLTVNTYPLKVKM